MTIRKKHRGAPVVESRCAAYIFKGYPAQLVERYTKLAEEAEDSATKQLFLQHAEHYRRGEWINTI